MQPRERAPENAPGDLCRVAVFEDPDRHRFVQCRRPLLTPDKTKIVLVGQGILHVTDIATGETRQVFVAAPQVTSCCDEFAGFCGDRLWIVSASRIRLYDPGTWTVTCCIDNAFIIAAARITDDRVFVTAGNGPWAAYNRNAQLISSGTGRCLLHAVGDFRVYDTAYGLMCREHPSGMLAPFLPALDFGPTRIGVVHQDTLMIVSLETGETVGKIPWGRGITKVNTAVSPRGNVAIDAPFTDLYWTDTKRLWKFIDPASSSFRLNHANRCWFEDERLMVAYNKTKTIELFTNSRFWSRRVHRFLDPRTRDAVVALLLCNVAAKCRGGAGVLGGPALPVEMIEAVLSMLDVSDWWCKTRSPARPS